MFCNFLRIWSLDPDWKGNTSYCSASQVSEGGIICTTFPDVQVKWLNDVSKYTSVAVNRMFFPPFTLQQLFFYYCTTCRLINTPQTTPAKILRIAINQSAQSDLGHDDQSLNNKHNQSQFKETYQSTTHLTLVPPLVLALELTCNRSLKISSHVKWINIHV